MFSFQEILCEEYLELTLIFKSDHSVIMPIVEFIYYGKTSFTEKYIKEIVSAAKFLGIKGLSNIEFENSGNLLINWIKFYLENFIMNLFFR